MFSVQKCASVMRINLAVAVFVCGSMAALWTHHQAHAEIQFDLDGSFIHDFSDGLPTTWIPLGSPQELYASNGDFITDRTRVLPHQSLSYVELRKAMLTDFSIRTQARMLQIRDQGGTLPGLGAAVSISGRTCNEGLGLGHVCNDSEIGRFPGADWMFIDVRPNGEVHTAQSAEAEEQKQKRIVETDIRPLEEDFNIQVDAFGQDINFWVWPAGEPRPEEPLIAYTSQDNPTLAPGGLMFGTVYAKAAFHHVHVSHTPIEELTGDFDFDFQVNAADIDLLSTEIAATNPRPWFDLDGDGAVTSADRNVWVESESIGNTFFGDADLNGEVDFEDFLLLSNNFGQSGGWAQGDFDGSGNVLFGDFLLLSSNFGNTREVMARSVPEPNASVLMVLTCFMCLVGRRNRLSEGLARKEEL